MAKKQRIKLTKTDGRYMVDPIDQCGSPIVGYGDTPLEALVFFICENEKVNIELIDDTNEVFSKRGVFEGGWNSRQKTR